MHAVIFGGGKIARGFIAQLLNRSGYQITFVELSEDLVSRLKTAGRYYVNVMGNPSQSEWISGYACLTLSDTRGIAKALSEADIAFTSVGGKNLESLADVIAAAWRLIASSQQKHVWNIVTCENWKNPALILQKAIEERLGDTQAGQLFLKNVGISESVVMRSGVEPAKDILKIDPNAVSVTDFWELPIDKMRMRGTPPVFEGAEYMDHFEGFLQQKLYTFNTTNATIAYLGRLRGIEDLAEAANDPQIVEIVSKVHNEINPAISAELGIDLQKQILFSQKALKKYQDRAVTDYTERHARDPLRKIGPTDRIVGTLRLVQKHSASYEWIATTLAAALYYPVTNPQDPSAAKLEEMRKTLGIEAVLQQISGIDPKEEACHVTLERINYLKEKGWLHV